MPTNDKLAQLHDRLATQVEARHQGHGEAASPRPGSRPGTRNIDSQDWREFLSLAARFHRYSTGVSGISEVRE